MTNYQRVIHHFTTYGNCLLCSAGVEDINHVFRGCPRTVDDNRVLWHRPRVGWVKLNTDSGQSPSDGFATCGGVLWDCHQRWLMGFYKYIGICSIMEVELWGLYWLSCVCKRGFRHVEAELDCQQAFQLLQVYQINKGTLSILIVELIF
ncbi:hypothetical protein F3Y22_tig00110677pilonHSYRG00095 [Hibiscus syriacus]|uniref:RNase H type-1 domain-containing protein n=1 Tax=Hibiscus syriacus TaxID=106335 RepID=A0A6A2ZWU0_HIBSY|nr:hypothetical protein F3Y22_tig00110677pilonHSYRG00095 [Hibiscus syriacus]